MSSVLILRLLIPVALVLAVFRLWKGWRHWRHVLEAAFLGAFLSTAAVVINDASIGLVVLAFVSGVAAGLVLIVPRKREE